MTYTASGGAAAAAAAGAIANAIKASGAIIKTEPGEFVKILNRADNPLVAFAIAGFFGKNYQYLTNYKGLIFFCKADDPIHLPGTVEVINCKKIWIPA